MEISALRRERENAVLWKSNLKIYFKKMITILGLFKILDHLLMYVNFSIRFIELLMFKHLKTENKILVVIKHNP